MPQSLSAAGRQFQAPRIELSRVNPLKAPKHWRHYSLIALAAVVATLALESPLSRKSFDDNNEVTAPALNQVKSALANERLSSLLPAVKDVALPPLPVAKENAKAPYVAAANAILIDDQSKLPLYEKAADQKIAVASTTKIVTALVAIEKLGDLNQRVTISKNARNQIGSTVGYKVGETATLKELLYGLKLVSGNDSALALSEQLISTGGADSTNQFVVEMNKMAERLGMNNSRFFDPAGLNDNGYSTASDMVKAMSRLIESPVMRQIIGTANYVYTSPEGVRHDLPNSNRLVKEEMYYAGVIGGKTGYTPKTAEGGAGHCLVVSAERNGRRLIAAVFGTYSNAPEASAQVARQLLDYGFENFTWQTVSR